MDFKERFLQIDEKKRQAYLYDILTKDPKQRNNFLEIFSDEFVVDPPNTSEKDPVNRAMDEIREIANDLSSELNDLDFEDIDWYSNEESGYYKEDYEIAEDYCKQEFRDVLEYRFDTLKSNLTAGSLTEVIIWIAGIYQGCQESDIDDPNEYFYEEPEELFINDLRYILSEIDISGRHFTEQDLSNSLHFALKYSKAFLKESGEFLKAIEGILCLCIRNREQATFASSLMQKYEVNMECIPIFTEQMLTWLGDENNREIHYEKTFLKNQEVSIRFVNYLKEKVHPEFDRYTKKLLLFYTYNVSDFLLEVLERGSELYVEALKEKVLHEHQIDTYKQLVTFLDGPALANFIESINNDIFKAEVLALHKQFDKIILMLEKNINSNNYYSDFNTIINHLLEHRVDKSFELISKRAKIIAEDSGSRHRYEALANTLKLAIELNVNRQNISDLVLDIYHVRPSRPALRDEFRKAGIVNKDHKVIFN